METMRVPSETLCLTLKRWKWGYLVFTERDWSQECCHGNNMVGVTFVMYISGAKFENHCWIFLIECYTVLIKPLMMSSLKKKKRYSKRDNAILLYFEKPFK